MRVGFIGLGNMGRHMSMHILDGGHELTVHDLRPTAADAHIARGARWADSPRAVAEASELVFTSLPGPPQVEQVVLGEDGILAGVSAGMTYIDLSTNSPTVIRRLADVLATKGVSMLDAPVSGGPNGAEKGTLAVMVGGDAALYERLLPVLQLIGDKVELIGPIGNGTVAKLAHNVISIGSRMVLAEAFTLGVKAGVSPHALLKAVQGGSFGQGRLLNHRLPNVIFKGDFDSATFTLNLSLKDLRLAMDLAREYEVPVKFLALAEQETVEAVAEGLGEKDSTATFLLQERRAGVQLRG